MTSLNRNTNKYRNTNIYHTCHRCCRKWFSYNSCCFFCYFSVCHVGLSRWQHRLTLTNIYCLQDLSGRTFRNKKVKVITSSARHINLYYWCDITSHCAINQRGFIITGTMSQLDKIYMEGQEIRRYPAHQTHHRVSLDGLEFKLLWYQYS